MVMQMALMSLPFIQFTALNTIFIQTYKNQSVKIGEALTPPYIWDGYFRLYMSKNCMSNIQALKHYLFYKKN
jgi:hypothetical protein